MSRLSPQMRLCALLMTVLLGLSGCTLVGGPGLGHKSTVTAYFTDAAGVFVGNDVGVLGVSIGRITKIEPVGSQVKVTMKIDPDQPIPATAGAVVVSRSAATDRYIELTPVYSSGPRMSSGATIPVDRTRTPVEFDQVLGTLSKFSSDISGSGATREAIARLLDASAGALGGKGKLVNNAITSLGSATNSISAQRQNAGDTLIALDKLTGTLAANQQTVRTFVKQVATASDILAEERGNFRTTLREVTAMITVVSRFARQNRAEIRSTIARTNATFRTVLDKRAQTEEILRVLPLALTNLRRTLTPDNRVLVRLDPSALTPIGGLVQQVCKMVPGDLCTAIGLDPSQVTAVLGGLLGLGGKP